MKLHKAFKKFVNFLLRLWLTRPPWEGTGALEYKYFHLSHMDQLQLGNKPTRLNLDAKAHAPPIPLPTWSTRGVVIISISPSILEKWCVIFMLEFHIATIHSDKNKSWSDKRSHSSKFYKRQCTEPMVNSHQ